MTGRSLHDALLTVLSNGPLRARLIGGGNAPDSRIAAEEWAILARLPDERLRRTARFLARHYYRERIVRLFRHVRRLAFYTGRDPVRVLEASTARTELDEAILGTPASAERLLTLVEAFLLQDDDEIRQDFPFWRDLVRYQAAMFRVEAGEVRKSWARHPSRSTSALILDLERDIPTLLARLRTHPFLLPRIERISTPLLITCTSRRQVMTVRCTKEIRLLFETADGRRDIETLASTAGLQGQQAEGLLRQMKEIGAIWWDTA